MTQQPERIDHARALVAVARLQRREQRVQRLVASCNGPRSLPAFQEKVQRFGGVLLRFGRAAGEHGGECRQRVSAEAGERFERCGAAFAGKGQFVDECGIQSGYNARNASSGFQKSGSACAKRSTVATTVAMPVSVA